MLSFFVKNIILILSCQKGGEKMKAKYLYASTRYDIQSGFISNKPRKTIALHCGDELQTLSRLLPDSLDILLFADEKKPKRIIFAVGLDSVKS